MQATWILLLFLAQVDDVITTAFGMAHGTVEGNPALQGFVVNGPQIVGFWMIKLLVTFAMLGVVLLVNRFESMHPGPGSERLRRMCLYGNKLAVVVLTAVAVNNLFVALS